MATIRKRGSRYNVQIRKEGYPSITKTFTSISVARKWVTGIEADMERHLYVEVPNHTTVKELLKRYERQILPAHRGNQAEGYRLKTLKRHLGALTLVQLTPKEVATYRDIRLQEISPASLKRELTILSQVLTVASRDWGISIPQNPVQMISLPKADKARTRRLEIGEEAKLLHGSNSKLNRVITLALETAMRRAEILNIKKSHIDFNKSVLSILSTKTDTPRTIPLSRDAVTVLREQLRASERQSEGVIPLHETTVFDYSPRGLSGEFLKRCRRNGIENLHFHDLRHEATSRLFEKGLNPVEVATITGHKDTRMLMRYTHLRAEDLVGRLG
jgi:integrase